MSDSSEHDAWNNFVMGSRPEDYQAGSIKRAAGLQTSIWEGRTVEA